MTQKDNFLPINKKAIEDHINKILDDFISDNFEQFIKNLLKFRKFIVNFNPENLNLSLVDFLMDENMWNWIVATVNKKPTDFDWEAAEYIATDLKDILENNN